MCSVTRTIFLLFSFLGGERWLNSKKQVCHYHTKIRLDEMSYFIFSFSYLDLMIKSNCSDAFYPAQIKCIMFYDAFFPPYAHLWFKLYSSGENENLHSCNSTTTPSADEDLVWFRSPEQLQKIPCGDYFLGEKRGNMLW